MTRNEIQARGNCFCQKFVKDSKRSLQIIQNSHPHGSLDEQAVPSYLNPNPLARWLFWQRLRVCIPEILAVKGTKSLDFGCGTGVILPILSENFETVIGVDIVPQVAQQHIQNMKKAGWPIKENITLMTSLDNTHIPDNHFDLILALDVLEHVKDLESLLSLLASKLKKTGIILVSGPTENLLYKTGRFISGYSGHYHLRNIYDINRSMAQYYDVKVIKRLIRPFTLFLILKGTKK